MDDWYQVKEEDIEKLGGKNILNLYSNSLQKALTHLFPEVILS